MTHPDPPPHEQQLRDEPELTENAPTTKGTWIAIAVVILGLVVVGVAVAAQSVWIGVAGGVLALAGAGFALYSGVMTNVET